MSHETSDAGHAAREHDHGHGGNGKYIAVFVALCVLTSASFFTYSSAWDAIFSPNPHVKWAFMMAVSCTKALLVILFFMHVLWEANWKYVLTIPAAMMSIVLMLALAPDVGLRTSHYTEERWVHAADPVSATAEAEGHGDEPAHTEGASH
jgi:cytochrome c oxidase subunit 4